MSDPFSPLTKAETKALWNAVQAFALQVREMKKMDPGFAPLVVEREEKRVADAKRALRKVNELRKQGL